MFRPSFCNEVKRKAVFYQTAELLIFHNRSQVTNAFDTLFVFVLCGQVVTMRCLAARVNYKTLIVICALFTLITVLLWNRCSSDISIRFLPRAAFVVPSAKISSSQQQPPQPPEPPPVVGVVGGIKYEEIDCLINDESTIKGRREGGEIYLPFSWVEKYFEVYGKVVQYDGYDRFEFQHSYSKVYAQREPYHPEGVFMSFEGYNVEVRDRVKCISGVEGKEILITWSTSTFFKFVNDLKLP